MECRIVARGMIAERMTNAACIHALHTTASQAKVSEYISEVRNKQGTAAAQQYSSASDNTHHLLRPIRLIQDSLH
jgi:predicted transcriptional regulator